MNKRLSVLLGVFLIAPGLYASEDAQFEREREAKARSAAINADAELATSLIHEELEGTQDQKAERVIVLRDAFNGCKEGFYEDGRSKKKLTQEQLEAFPTELGDYIASFLDDRTKHKFIARHTKHCIPAVMIGQDSPIPGLMREDGIFGDMQELVYKIIADPEIDTIIREFIRNDTPTGTGTGTYTRTYFKDQYREITGKNTLFLTRMRSKNDAIVYKLHPAYIKQLLKLTNAQLSYIVGLYDMCHRQIMRVIIPSGIEPMSGEEGLKITRARLAELGMEEFERRMDEAVKLIRTPEQITIHNSLPAAIRRCLERSYTFVVPVAPAAAVVAEEVGE